MSMRSRKDAMCTTTRGGKRINQSPHTTACTCLSVSSPKTRDISSWRIVSSSISPQGTFLVLGGNPLWSLRIATRHVRQITSVSFTTSWWKSLLGEGAWPTFSMRTLGVLIVYNFSGLLRRKGCQTKVIFCFNTPGSTHKLLKNIATSKASWLLWCGCVCAGNSDQLHVVFCLACQPPQTIPRFLHYESKSIFKNVTVS